MNVEMIKRESITGSRRISNYAWVLILTIGGLGFLLSGISSYLHTVQFIIQKNGSKLQFFT